MNYKDYIIEVPDFPIKGVSFKDISPLLADQEVFRSSIAKMGDLVGKVPDYWIGIDARGFIFASALAVYFGGGVVMCRKKDKLPPPTIDAIYESEYSRDFLSIKKGNGTAVIVDDVLATGGTLNATNHVAKLAGYDVKDNVVLIDLKYIPRVKDFNFKVKGLIEYE